MVELRNDKRREEDRRREQGERKSVTTKTSRSRWPGILLIVIGLLLILSSPALVWMYREKLAEVGPQVFMTLWYGAGGLAMLDFTAGLPLGAILVAMGGACLFDASGRWRRVLLALLGIYTAYFVYHAFFVFRYTSVPFASFAVAGFLLVVLFLALVWVWVRRRSRSEPRSQRGLDLQMGGGLCFFTAAWEACGLAGAPGFAIYPEVAEQLGNQSFLVGQVVAVQVFICLGFVLILLAMRAERPRNPQVNE